MKFLKKLDARGVVHHLAFVIVVLGVAIGGTAYLVASHADSTTLGATQVSDIKSECTLAKTLSGDTVDTAHVANCESDAQSIFVTAATQGAAGTYVKYIGNTAEANADLKACQAVFGITVFNTANKRQFGVDGAASACQNDLGQDEDAAAAKPHDYEGHIVATNYCNNIEAEAQDEGSLPTSNDNMSVTVELTGGPYPASLADASRLGPNDPNDSNISGTSTSNTYHHWTSPIAVSSYNGATPITATLIVKANGQQVSFKSSNPSQVINHCQPIPTPTPSKNGRPPVSTPAPVSTAGQHQYSAHMVVATCNNIEATAHDFGSDPSGKVAVTVTMTGGAYSETTTLPSGLANEQNLTNTKDNTTYGFADYYHWATPDTLKDYTGDKVTTLVLTVQDNGHAVGFTGSPVILTLGACKASKAVVVDASDTCTADLPKDASAADLSACESIEQQAWIAKLDAKAQASLLATLPGSDVNSDTTTCNAQAADLQNYTAFELADYKTACVDQLELQQAAAAAAKPSVIQITPPKKNVVTRAADSVKNFFEHLIGHNTPCTQKNFSQGDSGSCVRGIQILVTHAGDGTNLSLNAKFDASTTAAVKAFQKSSSLSTDGIVGPLTWGQLCSDSSSSQATISGYSVAKTYKDVGCDKQASSGTNKAPAPPPSANSDASTCKADVKEDTPPLPASDSSKYIKDCAKSPASTIKAAEAEATKIIEDNDQGGGGGGGATPNAAAYSACVKTTNSEGLSSITRLKDIYYNCAVANGNVSEQEDTLAAYVAAENSQSNNPCAGLTGSVLRSCQETNE